MPAKRVDIVKIKLVRESSILYAARSVSSPRDTAEFFRTLLGDADREHFVVMCLNAKNEPNAVQVVSTGTLGATLVHPREIFKTAILATPTRWSSPTTTRAATPRRPGRTWR